MCLSQNISSIPRNNTFKMTQARCNEMKSTENFVVILKRSHNNTKIYISFFYLRLDEFNR